MKKGCLKKTWPTPAFRLKSLLIDPQGWLKIYMTHPPNAKGATNLREVVTNTCMVNQSEYCVNVLV